MQQICLSRYKENAVRLAKECNEYDFQEIISGYVEKMIAANVAYVHEELQEKIY